MRAGVVLVLALAVAAQAATILEIAQSLPQFSTLVSVAGQAGIAKLLSDAGSKTVFAPTNDAFAQLGNNTLGWIVNQHNQQHLLSVLYYHIAPGALTTSFYREGLQIATLDQSLHDGPQTVTISGSAGGYRVNSAKITGADVIASNGVIEVIDRVLVPANIGLPANDIVQAAQATPALSTLVQAVTAAGLAAALSRPNGPYVVFAPTNEAFAAVPSKVLNCLLQNKKALTDVLLFHVVAGGFVYSEQIANGTSVQTLAGKPLTLNVAGNTVLVNYGQGFEPSAVVIPNVDTANGVVHVINKVIFDNTGPCATTAADVSGSA